VLRGDLTVEQGDAAMARFGQLELERFPADRLRPRTWDLRGNLTAYDATYVALAEAVGATALLTTDAGSRARPDSAAPSAWSEGHGTPTGPADLAVGDTPAVLDRERSRVRPRSPSCWPPLGRVAGATAPGHLRSSGDRPAPGA
jgi:hypothetical protein